MVDKIIAFETTNKNIKQSCGQCIKNIEKKILESRAYEIKINDIFLKRHNCSESEIMGILVEKGYRVIKSVEHNYYDCIIDYTISWRMGEEAGFFNNDDKKKGISETLRNAIMVLAIIFIIKLLII